MKSYIKKSYLVWFISIFTLVFSFNAVATEPLRATQKDTVKDHRYMKSKVTMYRNGKLVISTNSWSRKNWNGLKGHSVFVVIVDKKGNAIWASKSYRMKTIGGTKDLGTSSDHTDVNQETAPAAIGKHAHSIDIYHSAGNLSQNRDSQVRSIKKAIKTAEDIVKEVKDAVASSLK